MSDADQGTGDSEAVFAMLEELGVVSARTLGLDHPGVVALCDANRQLEEGQPGLAMHTLEVELGEPDSPQPMEIGAAAFVLRGKAHEAQDRAYHARIDYEYALKMRANIPYAIEAIRRIDQRG
ncbi:MAG: hypothetical protein F4Z77_04775 [Dehalococcoidia bacterium]|nr:hypothetical protein [Dehalococcoidia bacterium]MYA54077.1 hypothetical protein [Dehalococcoidia bacterium]